MLASFSVVCFISFNLFFFINHYNKISRVSEIKQRNSKTGSHIFSNFSILHTELCDISSALVNMKPYHFDLISHSFWFHIPDLNSFDPKVPDIFHLPYNFFSGYYIFLHKIISHL